MKLITYYVTFTAIGDTLAAFLCLALEKWMAWISMPLFLALFFVILWAAWILAVKLTEPKAGTIPADEIAAGQSA